MLDKELLSALRLYDRTIIIGLNDEYARLMLEKKIDFYLKKYGRKRKKNY